MGAIERIRDELNSVRQDLERPQRSRSVGTPQRHYYQPMVPMSPVIAVAPTAWPPPPLPPMSSEVIVRLSSLEAQRVSTDDVEYERLIEQLRVKLRDVQAWVAQQEGLQEQIERCNMEWRERVQALEARSLQRQLEAEARLKQATCDAEERGHKECEKLRAEVQAAKKCSPTCSQPGAAPDRGRD